MQSTIFVYWFNYITVISFDPVNIYILHKIKDFVLIVILAPFFCLDCDSIPWNQKKKI